MRHYTMDHLPRSLCHGPLALINGTLFYVFLLTVKKTGLRERSSARALTVKTVEPSYEKMGQSRASDQMKVSARPTGVRALGLCFTPCFTSHG